MLAGRNCVIGSGFPDHHHTTQNTEGLCIRNFPAKEDFPPPSDFILQN